MLTLKICVAVFSGFFKDRMLNLGIRMDNELLYCGIELDSLFIQFSLFYIEKLQWLEHIWDQEN